MIELVDVKKSFGDNIVLKGITANFYPGRVNMIIGSSGSGKSVLMKSMVGVYKIDSGSICYGNQDFTQIALEDQKQIRQEIGMLFQNSALFDSMTVQDNIMFPLTMFAQISKQEKLDRVNHALEKVGLAGNNAKFPGELSGGMMKRVGIARAIILNPKYLYCDEPNSGLDPLTAMKIDDLIQQITEEFKTTTIINTHDMNSVMEIGDHIIFVYKGLKAWEGDKRTILETDNERLNEFVFSSVFLKDFKNKQAAK